MDPEPSIVHQIRSGNTLYRGAEGDVNLINRMFQRNTSILRTIVCDDKAEPPTVAKAGALK